MKTLDRINDLLIKGWITIEEYEALLEKHTPKDNSDDKIKNIISSMNTEELLETYKNDDTEVIKYLIITELENRIEK